MGNIMTLSMQFYVMPRGVKGHMKKKGILGGSMDPYV